MKFKILLLFLVSFSLFAQTPPYNLQIAQQPLPIVTNTSINYTGPVGTTTYWYSIVARYSIGNASPSTPFQVTGINPIGGGSVSISWGIANPSTYNLTFDVIRLNSSAIPTSCSNCLVASNIGTGPVIDTLGSLAGYTFNTYGNSSPLTLTIDNQNYPNPQLRALINGNNNQSQIISGLTLPSYCQAGDVFTLIGSNGGFYYCSSLNTWINSNTQPPTYSALRAPQVTDDGTLGYLPNMLWFYNGLDYLNILNAPTNQAVWQIQPALSVPSGSVATNTSAIYSVCVAVNGWTGNLFTITRGSDSTTLAINAISTTVNGINTSCANWQSVDAFCFGTACGVSKWNDQSGNANDLTQATFVNMPSIVGATVNGFRAITFAGNFGNSTAQFMNNSGLTLFRSNSSAFAVVQPVSNASVGSQNFGTFFTLGSAGDWAFQGSSVNFGLDLLVHNVNTVSNVALDIGPALIGYASGSLVSGLGLTIFSNSSSQVLPPVSVSDGNQEVGVEIGNTAVAAGSEGGFNALLFGFVAHTFFNQDLYNVQSAVYQQFGIKPQVLDTLALMGDSIGQGFDGLNNLSWFQQEQNLLKRPRRQFNFSISGETAADFVGFMPTILNRIGMTNTRNANICIIALGTNDLNAGTSAITIEGYLQSIASSCHSKNFKVIIATIISRNLTASQEVQREQLNTWIESNYLSFTEALADVGASNELGCTTCWSNGTYFVGGGVHPNTLGMAAYAGLVAQAVNSLP